MFGSLRVLALGTALLIAAGGSAGFAQTGPSSVTGSTSAAPKAAKRAPKAVKRAPKAKRIESPPVTTGWNWHYSLSGYIADFKTTITPGPRPLRPYAVATFQQHAQSIPLDIAAVAALELTVGLKLWDWGSRSFHFKSEGFFGKSTDFGGADKFGHAWTANALSDFFTWRLQARGFDKYESALTGAILSGLTMLAIEVGDGFSPYGASYEDLIADAVGIGFSFLRNTVPGLREKIDYRMQHIRTSQSDTFGADDYSGKKFVLALKFAGFEQFKETPLRYLELHGGYFTRGYMDWERAAGARMKRIAYVGLGLNVSEILFTHSSIRDTTAAAIGRSLLEYIQVPYTYIATDNSR